MFSLLLAAGLTFHPITIAQMNAESCDHWKKLATHLQVEGFVTYKAKEDDGDWHIRICDSPKVKTMDKGHCIVAEIVPALPLPPPKVGDHVSVQGIYRYDAEDPGHHWQEIHPLLALKVLPAGGP